MGAEQKAQTATPPGFTLQSAIHLLAKAELFDLNKFSAIFFVTGKVCRAGGGVRKR
jgi:hypothetical protein